MWCAMSEEVGSLATQRMRALRRDNWECRECGDPVGFRDEAEVKTAHVHHVQSRSDGGTDELENLKTLCERCHRRIHGQGWHPEMEALLPEIEQEARRIESEVGLSKRQSEVVAGKLFGLSHSAIGQALGMEKGTVDTHNGRVKSKMRRARKTVREAGHVYPVEES